MVSIILKHADGELSIDVPEPIFQTLSEKIYNKFPRCSRVDRVHAKWLLNNKLIERAQLYGGRSASGYSWVYVATLECKAWLDEHGYASETKVS